MAKNHCSASSTLVSSTRANIAHRVKSTVLTVLDCSNNLIDYLVVVSATKITDR